MKICGIVGEIEGYQMKKTADPENMGRFKDLFEEIRRLSDEGVEEFVVSMDDGAGLMAANAVLWNRLMRPTMRLTCLLRWEDQAARWPESVRDIWFETFRSCDREVLLEHRLSPDNAEKRDRWLIEHCDGLLAFWNGGASPVWRTAAAARAAGLPVVELRT